MFYLVDPSNFDNLCKGERVSKIFMEADILIPPSN